MIASAVPPGAIERPSRLPLRIAVTTVGVAALSGLVVAYLVTSGYWYVAVGILAAVPSAVVLHRNPLIVVTVWLLAVPLIGETSSAAVRKLFWLVHRAAPPAALIVIALAAMIGTRARRPARLGWPELLMTGYVAASVLSIAYTSTALGPTLILLYDRVVVPMCLYLIIRLLQPEERDLRALVLVVAFVLISQSVLGVISWRAPHALPSDWLGKVGERTTGSLRAPEVFGATVIFCGVLIVHAGMSARRRLKRSLGVLLFALALIMLFLSFSRSVWLAGFIALVGTVLIHRGVAKRLILIVFPLILAVAASGLLAQQAIYARQRLHSAQSEESALSRLPVFYAATRMFASKPLTGWGYENFDRYDRRFQGTVANLVAPDKDHASHNLYLTILAEQGIVGIVLVGGPAVYWLVQSRSRRRWLPAGGLMSRKLLGALWIAFAGFALVNNFYRMQTPFALGMWWLTLGLIASLVARAEPPREEAIER